MSNSNTAGSAMTPAESISGKPTKQPSSPLNPTRTPANSLPPSSAAPSLPIPPAARPRGHSFSSVSAGDAMTRSGSSSPQRAGSPSYAQQRMGLGTMGASTSTIHVALTSPSTGVSQSYPPPPISATRSRSRSPAGDRVVASMILENPATPPNAPPVTWWGRNIPSDRPWRDPASPVSSIHSSPSGSPRPGPAKLRRQPPLLKAREESDDEFETLAGRPALTRRTTVPREQTQGWERTRVRVTEALNGLIPVTLLAAHELLVISTDVLKFAPVPGLEIAAHLLLNIWDNVQSVDMNRLACLRLAERCANLLISILQEVHDMGDKVEAEVEKPLRRLEEAFTQVRDFLVKQAHRPFLKRYLKRTETLTELANCDISLTDALSMFSLSVQMRIFKQAKDTEERLEHDNKAVLEAIARAQQHMGLGSPADPQATPRQIAVELPMDREEALETLRNLHTTQNTLDFAHDTADLRALLRDALAQGDDAEMLRVLQVGRAEMPEALKAMQRALERVAVAPPSPTAQLPASSSSGVELQRTGTLSSSHSSESSGGLGAVRDTLDREFIETGIDALRRMSKGGQLLPSWTITRYEVDRDVKIGIGFFSDVYKGTWRGRIVAIKCLAETTPRELFVREVNIWKTLKHPNVLELYGASGASGDGPWFFVCPYMRFGSLSGFLRRVAQQGDVAKTGREGDLLRFMHEVAKGMEYLHAKGVLHGDLKAANVLVDDRIHCLVSDFGQSEMKSEAYRLSGNAPPRGTLRWQAPELMLGSSDLTPEMDVYSYAMCCVEILSMGRLPWPLMSDDQVRNFVLNDKARPKVPVTRFDSPALHDLLSACWHDNASFRPTFEKIVKESKQLRRDAELPVEGFDELASPPVSPGAQAPEWQEMERAHPSPDMHPVPLPKTPPMDIPFPVSPARSPELASSEESYHTVSQTPLFTHYEDTVSDVPEPVLYTASSSRASSIFTPSTKSSSAEDLVGILDFSGYESPLPHNEQNLALRNERRYRLLLTHEFHPSLTLPLWSPSSVAVGAVGYLAKPSGSFVTLLNCFYPDKGKHADMNLPSVYGYGRVATGNQRQDKRTAAQRGLDAIAGFLTFKSKSTPGDLPVSRTINRRYGYPLRTGHKSAYLCTETTTYRYIENLDAPKKWFKSNADTILQHVRPEHGIQKEDLFLVIGTLDSPDHALFVSHNHPDGQAHFNVFATPKNGQPWGSFTTDAETELAGPAYHEPIHGTPLSACKISDTGDPWKTVLLARLRFKPDVAEPTSL